MEPSDKEHMAQNIGSEMIRLANPLPCAILLLLTGCGLSPPSHIKLDGGSALPTGDDCRDGYQLKEAYATSLKLPVGDGVDVKLSYAVMCGKKAGDRFVKNGLYVGWGNSGHLIARGQFRHDSPSGKWTIY